MIKIVNLKKVYPLKKGQGYLALKGISLNVEKGEFIAICGPSGCGKSTLLNILGFLDFPTEGNYFFKGKDVSHLNDNERTYLRRKIGFVFQSFNLLPRFSAIENVCLPLLYQGYKKNEALKIAREFIERVGLKDKLSYSILELSGGERQRIGLARALSINPEILLADEPTGNLDSKNSIEIMNMLKELNIVSKMTIIMVTHDLKLAHMCNRIVKIKDGLIEL